MKLQTICMIWSCEKYERGRRENKGRRLGRIPLAKGKGQTQQNVVWGNKRNERENTPGNP